MFTKSPSTTVWKSSTADYRPRLASFFEEVKLGPAVVSRCNGRNLSIRQRNKLRVGTTVYRLGDNSSESIPESLHSLSRARRSRQSRVRITTRHIPSGSRPYRSSTESMTQLPLLQSRSYSCNMSAISNYNGLTLITLSALLSLFIYSRRGNRSVRGTFSAN
jgi:hypothetical protein